MTDGEERRGMPRWARRWAIIAAVVVAGLIGYAGYRLYSVGRDRVDDGGSTEPGEKGRPRDTVFAVER